MNDVNVEVENLIDVPVNEVEDDDDEEGTKEFGGWGFICAFVSFSLLLYWPFVIVCMIT